LESNINNNTARMDCSRFIFATTRALGGWARQIVERWIQSPDRTKRGNRAQRVRVPHRTCTHNRSIPWDFLIYSVLATRPRLLLTSQCYWL